MWTGDNLGTWEHMEVGLKMVLANGLGGMSFAGGEAFLFLPASISPDDCEQLMLAASSEIRNLRCSFAGISWAHSSRSSALMRI